MRTLYLTVLMFSIGLSSTTQSQTCCQGIEYRSNAPKASPQPPPPASSSRQSSSRQQSPSRTGNAASIQSATDALLQMLDDDSKAQLDQDYQDQLRRAYEAAQEEAKRNEEALRQEQMTAARQRAMKDPTLDPWSGHESSEGASKNKNSQLQKTANSNSSKDPSANYAGKPCEYFTRPSDEAHLNYYANGATVVYGDKAYQCIDRRWRYKHPANVYTDEVRRQYDAVKIEGG